MSVDFTRDITIIGGCGHVGLPLGIAFADRGLKVALYDIDDAAVELVNAGTMPFQEEGADERLKRVVDGGTLVATTDPVSVGSAENVVVVIGTPVDEHLNPDPQAVPRALEPCSDYLTDGQLLILRSTVYPGVTALVERMIGRLGRDIDVAFCPERIAEGQALRELQQLPQIVAGRSARTKDRAAKLFGALTGDIIELEPEEAELAKLFTNTWRYIKFAISNQLYMIATDFGLDYEKIRDAITYNYPRAADLPGAGFAAGPCLLKDTMQLAAFNNNNFTLGNAAMAVNEGLPLYLVAKLEEDHDLSAKTVGVLGMAFKGGSDDTRSSLSYKLKRILQFKAGATLCHDPHVTDDPDLVSLEEVLASSDIVIVATPHEEYRGLQIDKPVVDIWNVLGKSARP